MEINTHFYRLFVFILAGVLLSLVFLLPLCSSQLIYEQAEDVDLKIPCYFNGSYCSGSAICNLTIFSPDDDLILDNVEMANQGSFHNYSLNATHTADSGEYRMSLVCIDAGSQDKVDSVFFITPTGNLITDTQGFTSMALLLSVVAIAFLFLLVSVKIGQSDKMFPIALFFMLVGILLSVYSVHLGYIYSRDILFPLGVENVQFKVYIGIMWGLIGMGLLGLLGLIFKTVKEIRIKKSMVNYGEGWNPQKKTYE